VGDVVSGAVRSFDRSDVVIDLGRADGIMPTKERVPTEEYQIGDRIRCYVVTIQSSAGGPDLILSRSHPNFVRRLFELEVAEISDGIVEIMGLAREPGYRTKIAVKSNDDKVDPVGACVGMRGSRVKNIVRELSGEKIDIVRFSEDPRQYVANALSPAKLTNVYTDEERPNVINVVADSDQLSLAIGKRGQNVRLTAKLLGWKIDVHRDESSLSFEDRVEMAIKNLAAIEGISAENAERLVKAGFLTIDGILAATSEDLQELVGLDAEVAAAGHAAATSASP
jgi:N utilization substance protein A